MVKKVCITHPGRGRGQRSAHKECPHQWSRALAAVFSELVQALLPSVPPFTAQQWKNITHYSIIVSYYKTETMDLYTCTKECNVDFNFIALFMSLLITCHQDWIS